MVQLPQFWLGCRLTFETKEFQRSLLKSFVYDFNLHRDTVERICFPICESNHWYMVCLSLKDGQIEYAEGLGKEAPSDMFEILEYLFANHLRWNTSQWKAVYRRLLICPPQGDGHSCGVVTLALMESQISGTGKVNWEANLSQSIRLDWFRRCLLSICIPGVTSTTDMSDSPSLNKV